MLVHKDIIIVFLFIFFVNLVILVLIISDLKKINKFLNNFSGSSLKSGKLFFYKLFEPIAFNIKKIIGNYEYKYRNEKYNNSRFVVINLSAISFSKNTSKISTSNGFTIFVNKY